MVITLRKRIDLHMHTLFSDGELLPSELARRAEVLGHSTIAITDHVDFSNIHTITDISAAIEDINKNWEINVVLGAEITHAPTQSIHTLAKKARELGAKIVVVHGETLSEPVIPGTNFSAVNCEEIDILAHPGLITIEEAELAKENDVALEISARKGHSLANGHVANIAKEVGCDLVIDTDTHSPDDLITFERSIEIALGAGLNEKEALKAAIDTPNKILKKHELI